MLSKHRALAAGSNSQGAWGNGWQIGRKALPGVGYVRHAAPWGAQVRGVAQLTGLVAVKLSIAFCMVGGLKAGRDCKVSYPQAATALL